MFSLITPHFELLNELGSCAVISSRKKRRKVLRNCDSQLLCFDYEDLFVIGELCYFLEFKKTPHLVKQGFAKRIDQVVPIFDSSFSCMVLHISCLCMNF